MATKNKEHSFFDLYNRFIADSKKGKRVQPNGKRISEGTIKSYEYTGKVIRGFCDKKAFTLRIKSSRFLNSREAEAEKNYWKKFYKHFTDYLYTTCGYFDNYVGLIIKNIKAFFNYLNKELVMAVGNFHKQFYVRKEEIGILTLMPEELNYLVFNKEFEQSLSSRMTEVKDVFVFGCTVALRVSDLLSLKKSSLRVINNQHYLAVRSQKTETDTLVKLPGYAVAILHKYNLRKGKLLPHFNKSNLNEYIKQLLELAGFKNEVMVHRTKRGKAVELKNKIKPYRFCDVASTHIMRRTAITTMLCLGMQEQLVRKISGHSANTKEFYRYVLWAQTYMDQETEKVFDKLQTKELKLIHKQVISAA